MDPLQQRLAHMASVGAVDPMDLTGIHIIDGALHLELLQRFVDRHLPRSIVLDECGLNVSVLEALVDAVLISHSSLTCLSLQRNALDASR